MIRAVRHGVRRLLARLAARLLVSEKKPDPRTQIQKVLVIRIDDRVGNVLLTTPLLVALSRALPEAEVDVLVSPTKQALVEDLACPVPLSRRHLFQRPVAFFAQLLRLRRAGYDVAIDASHWHDFSLSSAMLLAWTKAPIRIAHARGEARLFATHLIDGPGTAAEPEVRAKLRLLEPLALPSVGRVELATHVGEKGRGPEKIRGWLAREGLEQTRLVGLAPGSRKPDHRLPPAVFAELGKSAAMAGCIPVVVWGPGEDLLAKEVARGAGGRLAPPTDLEELAALFRRLRVVVTNDTGPMHLAVACGVPTIALFVHSDPKRWGHVDPPNVVIAADGRSEEEVLGEAQAALRALLSG